MTLPESTRAAAPCIPQPTIVAPRPRTTVGSPRCTSREDNFAIMPARPWVPREWMIHKRHLCVSHDRLLAIFAEIMRSGIGAGYGINLGTGEVIYQTSPAPYHEVAPAAAAGRFLVGIQGYDAFETRLVDRDGNVITTWPSHGIVLAGDALRVIELENVIPSRCHVSTLRADGTVHHGVHLPGYYTSPVIVGTDGSIVFWRDDAVMCVSPDGERLERLLTTPAHGRAHALALAGRAPGRVVLSWSTTVEEHGVRMSYSKLMVIDLES